MLETAKHREEKGNLGVAAGEPRENRTHISPEAAGEQSGQPVQASLASELLGPAWEGSSEGKKFDQT